MSGRRAAFAAAGLVAVLAVLGWLALGGREEHGPLASTAPDATATDSAARESPSPARTVGLESPSGLPAVSPSPSETATPERVADSVATGRVLAAGEPFEGARVDAVVAEHGNSPVESVSEEPAVSGPDGRFELHGLPTPPFRLRAQAPGWRAGWAEVGSIGNEGRVDGIVLALAAAGAISGRVTASGAPVADARVFTGDEQSNDLGTSLEAQASTAEDGTFRLDPVRPGSMTVAALHPREGFAAGVVTVADGEVATLALELAPLGRVRGTVVDPDGKPVAGAAVVAVDPGDLDLLPFPDGASRRLLTVSTRLQVTHTDDDGRFEFRTLVSSKPRLAVRAEGFGPGHAAVEVGADGRAATVEIRLRAE